MKLDIKRILDSTNLFVRRNRKTILLFAATVYLNSLVNNYFSSLFRDGWGATLRSLLFFTFSLYIFAFFTVKLIKKHQDSDPVNKADAPQLAWQRLLPLVFTEMLMSMIVIFGLVLLFLPGVFFAVTLSMAPFACLLEGRGPIDSLKRSADLTRNNRFRMFILYFLIITVLFAIPPVLRNYPVYVRLLGSSVATTSLYILSLILWKTLTSRYFRSKNSRRPSRK